MSKKNCHPGALVKMCNHYGLLLWTEGNIGVVLGDRGTTQLRRFKLRRMTAVVPAPVPQPAK